MPRLEPNFTSGFVERIDPARLAMIEITRLGERIEWSFGDVREQTALRSIELIDMGMGRGDVALTIIGNRPDWVITMLACFRIGAVVLPCSEQLRPKDIELRVRVASPAAIVCDRRNEDVLLRAAPPCPTLLVPSERPRGTQKRPPEAATMEPDDPVLITFTSGSTGEPKGVMHVHRYLAGQRLQAENWLSPRAGDLTWCTASTGWSKSARNAFIAPWLRGAAVVLHDGRFDADERLELVNELGVNVLCMSPTEYRMIAKRGALRPLPRLHRAVAAGEALDADTQGAWRDAVGLQVIDGYGQTETGQLTGARPAEVVPPGSMGRPLPGIRTWIEEDELVVDPLSVPTFFRGYLGDAPWDRGQPWRTGDHVAEDGNGFLHFVGRADDMIISAGYRIGPFEVESALVEHPAVADAAVVGAPDPERGSVVRAVVVLASGHEPSSRMVGLLQAHVRALTAPYKYPRIVDFAEALPRTTTGKVRRSALRD